LTTSLQPPPPKTCIQESFAHCANGRFGEPMSSFSPKAFFSAAQTTYCAGAGVTSKDNSINQMPMNSEIPFYSYFLKTMNNPG
jgi:hypothetical protein